MGKQAGCELYRQCMPLFAFPEEGCVASDELGPEADELALELFSLVRQRLNLFSAANLRLLINLHDCPMLKAQLLEFIIWHSNPLCMVCKTLLA